MVFVVIFAGGVGSRMGSEIPKQFLKVDEKPILIHVVEKFNSHPLVDGIVVVSKKEYINYSRDLCNEYGLNKVLSVIEGGDTGQGSIRNGIYVVAEHFSNDPDNDIVIIHDGVRPLITEQLITDNIACAKKYGNSISVSKAIETVIRVDENGMVLDVVDRSMCRNAKAPQCFRLSDIWNTHKKAEEDGINNAIDSATLMSSYGTKLYTVETDYENIKITTPNDYYMFKAVYEAKKENRNV